jgi:hypothetical protein
LGAAGLGWGTVAGSPDLLMEGGHVHDRDLHRLLRHPHRHQATANAAEHVTRDKRSAGPWQRLVVLRPGGELLAGSPPVCPTTQP